MSKETNFKVVELKEGQYGFSFPIEQTVTISMEDLLEQVKVIMDDASLRSIVPLTTNGRNTIPCKFKDPNAGFGYMFKVKFIYDQCCNLAEEVEVIEDALNTAVDEISNTNSINIEVVTAHYAAIGRPDDVFLDDETLIVNILIGDVIYG